jgi:transcriptional regulator with GAF, ATPase, and Fis domain
VAENKKAADSKRTLLWMRRVRDLSHRLTVDTDLRPLLAQILDAAVEITNAERGFLVRVLGRTSAGKPHLQIEEARGFDQTTLRGAKGLVSRTVVNRVLERGRGLVTTEEDAVVLGASSVVSRRVLSILCVPMRLRGEIQGVLYLDHRFREGSFSEEDLPLVATFGDQAALAIETTELLAKQQAGDERLRSALSELAELKASLTPEPPQDAWGRSLQRWGCLLGGSPAMLRMYEDVERASRSWAPVLIVGETGTGKTLVGGELHERGLEPEAPFVRVDPRDERPHFQRGGELLTRAKKGTIYVDEVAELAPADQGQLLSLLNDEETPCRIVASTKHDLSARPDFRQDLYYRLDVLRISVPPLRQRPQDVVGLLKHFFLQARRPKLELSAKAVSLLESYAWPGNVRELRNEALRLTSLTAKSPLSAQHLSEKVREGRGVSRGPEGFSGKTLKEVEREMVESALRDCGGNKARTARQLGIPRPSLYHLLKRHGLS